MIQSNELRIGNWVSDIHASEGKMWKVTEIRSKTCMYSALVSQYESLRPVRLSPEILEKCGFEADSKTSYGGWLSPKIGGGRIRLIKEDVGFSFFNGICKTIVKDLHTLQNYYPAWASGEELNYTP